MVELAPRGSTFEFTFAVFQKFFEKKCGVGWNNRVRKQSHNAQEKDCLPDEHMSDSETRVGSGAMRDSHASSDCGVSSTRWHSDPETTCEVQAETSEDSPRFKYVPNDEGMIKKLLNLTIDQEAVQSGDE